MQTQIQGNDEDMDGSGGEQELEERGHPYGVEPLGNIFLARSFKKINCRPGGLGKLRVLDVRPPSHCALFKHKKSTR